MTTGYKKYKKGRPKIDYGDLEVKKLEVQEYARFYKLNMAQAIEQFPDLSKEYRKELLFINKKEQQNETKRI